MPSRTGFGRTVTRLSRENWLWDSGQAFLPLEDNGKAFSEDSNNYAVRTGDMVLYPQDSDQVDRGDFAEDIYQCATFMECVEPAAEYYKDFYYPICIADVLDQRYRIEHKLGHGGFSTVWLVTSKRRRMWLSKS
jgi:hypothetical protein